MLFFVAWVNKAVDGVVGLLLFVAWVNKAVLSLVEVVIISVNRKLKALRIKAKFVEKVNN